MAEVQAQLFGDLADTFAAINRDPRALQETIEETPPTLAAATASFRVQTPFLARFADVSRRLGPGAAQRRALPLINGALSAGIPGLPAHARPGRAARPAARRAGDVVGEPEHAAVAARPAPRAAGHPPAIQQVAPYQTVCNYLVYFFNPLGTHLSETVPGGTQERIKAKLANLTQANTLGLTESLRPVDVPTDQNLRSGALKRCTPSAAARRSTSRATPTARAGRPVTRTGS